jgi:hypothetical protein
MNYETCEYNGISDQLRHDVLFYHSIPVFPGFPGRRDRILSLEISRDLRYGPTFYQDYYERGNQVTIVDLVVTMHCTLPYTLL